MAFTGYLIKVSNSENGTFAEISPKYIRAETYKVTPNQRMEWSAERDVNGFLHRQTVDNKPPKIEFETPLMTNAQINALNTIISNAYSDSSERKLWVQYYDPESDSYKKHECYLPDVQYKIRNIDTVNNVVNYEQLRYAFIGY